MKRRVALDGWNWGEANGTASVLMNLVRHLPPQEGIAFTLLVPPGKNPAGVPGHIEILEVGAHPPDHQRWLNAFAEIPGRPVDLFFFPGMALPAKPPGRFVSVLHDALPLHALAFRLDPFRRAAYLSRLRAHERAERIITVSQFSRLDLERRSGIPASKFTVIPNGVSAAFSRDSAAEPLPPEIQGAIGREPYLLYLGDLSWRKNVLTLARAYLGLPPGLRDRFLFVFTGSGPVRGKIESLFRKQRCQHRLRSLGIVQESVLPALMRGAALFPYPSLLEGFGLPILEAQASGVPVLCGEHSALPEVTGGAAWFTEVRSPKRLAESMERLLSDPVECGRLVEAGYRNVQRFTWFQTAKCLVDVLRAALG